MKKFIVLLLFILPIFLIITISFAGRIFSIYNYIYVEKVVFVNDLEEELDEDFVLKLNKGQSQQTSIKIFPELSTNKNVKYVSQNEQIATISDEGVVYGVGFGTTMVTVTTVDSQKVDTMLVYITDDNVAGINIVGEKFVNLPLRGTYNARVTITPETAINKNVVWSSSNPLVASVDRNGRITAQSAGEATITATTIDGGFTDSIDVVVGEVEDFKFTFPMPEGAELAFVNQSELMLKDYIEIINPQININDIKFNIRAGKDAAVLNENSGHLTFTKVGTIITIDAYVGEKENPTHKIGILLMYKQIN